ncbi:MAG: HPr family phosphocarrier protein [Marinisporobacter sp.]|jgi:phosphocarrier protein|nr:HPr family phosphocarrier protein [Marinisporobacter sp.]
MVKISVKIIDPAGLHTRPASMLASAAGKFSSKIELEYEDKKINMKSIMGMMALGIKTDSVITIVVDGDDEELVIATLKDVMSTNKIAE